MPDRFLLACFVVNMKSCKGGLSLYVVLRRCLYCTFFFSADLINAVKCVRIILDLVCFHVFAHYSFLLNH